MNKKLKRPLYILLVIVVGFLAQYFSTEQNISGESNLSSTDSELTRAFKNKQSNLQIKGAGEVVKVLSDDTKGSRHQRFLLELGSGQTLLVAHNIDLAPRVPSLTEGDKIEFYGEYEWSAKGGVIHWTHHDPRGSHVTGWLKHQGKEYK